MASIPPDVSRGSNGLAADWVLVGVSCLAVAMRLYAKGRILKRLGLDDVLMTTALVSNHWITTSSDQAEAMTSSLLSRMRLL